MDPELMRNLSDNLAEAKVKLTLQATVMIVELINSIADDPAKRLSTDLLRTQQEKAIKNVGRNLRLIKKAFGSNTVSAPMVIAFLPRLISAFCPPFVNPPPE